MLVHQAGLRAAMIAGWFALLPGLRPPGHLSFDAPKAEGAWARVKAAGTPVAAHDLGVPLPVLVTWLADGGLLFHGSDKAESRLEPARQTDSAMRPVEAVFATDVAQYALFFAVVDRSALVSQRVHCLPGPFGLRPRLYFSLDSRRDPWRDGVLTVVPRTSFERLAGTSEWHSRASVEALGHIAVGPEDFGWRSAVLSHTADEPMAATYARAVRQAWRVGARR